MITAAIVTTFPPICTSPGSLIARYISNSWSGKKEHISGKGRILLKNGNAHNTIKGTIIAVGVECVSADISIASVEANTVPIYPPKTIKKYACKKVIL